MEFATLLTKSPSLFYERKKGKTSMKYMGVYATCSPGYATCSPDMYGEPCGPEYGADCMPECDPSDGSDDCDPYYP
mgnify:CR=1 FL=1